MTRINKVNKRTVKLSTPTVPVMTAHPVSVDEVNVPATGASFSDMSYRDLQAIAKECGLKASGTKADLIERLT